MNREPIASPEAGFSTGLPGLDAMLCHLIPGDNVVWQVDGIEDYLPFVEPFIRHGVTTRRRTLYFRFARHRPLAPPQPGLEIHRVEPDQGFERFVTHILDVIEQAGREVLYVFDCLSDLAVDWYSDRMLGNFFMITCPFLLKLDTITYFALLKQHHSVHATDSIRQTAQVLLDVYRQHGRLYVHPTKVDQRYSPTLYMMHAWEGDDFVPVTRSATLAALATQTSQPWLDFSIQRPGVWVRAVASASQTLESAREGTGSLLAIQDSFQRLLRMAITRDERFARLARRYLDLDDLMVVLQRMIGTGLIGGKSLGMLLARAMLRKASPRWSDILEPHDSFFVGSDVFYTYLVQNGCWELRRRERDPPAFMERADEARRRLLAGTFPEYIRHQFAEMLDYFGQCPIVVRSSSLLEDSYGNAFSGKYETVFCANQGNPLQRLNAFMDAVRTVYASTMSRGALTYRAQRRLLDLDEQMSVLVQRVSGALHGTVFLPQVAGVAFSFNPYVWSDAIDPQAGVLRLVLGLGTRAVDRTGDDHTRLVALNAPLRQPYAAAGDERRYAQRQVDLIDLEANRLTTVDFDPIAANAPPSLALNWFASSDGRPHLSFERMLRETGFVEDMRSLLRILQDGYDYPVDVEFAANFSPDGRYCINLLQCRPFQVKIRGEGSRARQPVSIRKDDLLLESRGPIIGPSTWTRLDYAILVVPEVYGQLPIADRHAVARAIGRITRAVAPPAADAGAGLAERPTIILLGPGRWATTTPSLGVPVAFGEISGVSVLCEIAFMHAGLIPDVSLGTHFFNDLVEMDMLYLAVFPDREGHALRLEPLLQAPNRLPEWIPDARPGIARAIHVVRGTDVAPGTALHLNADAVRQRAVCYLARPER